MTHSHQLNMFKSNEVLKNKKRTWKTGTQVFTQDSSEIQPVL